jgi:hypothetical protein
MSQPPALFSGFEKPQQNWFKMPYAWTDITAKVTSLAELKVVEYVLKHTWGYQEYNLKKKISIDEFMHGRKRKDGTTIDLGTGLSKQSVIDGLKNAVKHGFLDVEKDDSDQARKKRYYSLKMQETSDEEAPASDPEPDNELADTKPERAGDTANLQPSAKNRAEVKHLDADVKNLDIRGQTSRHRSETDTLERYFNNNRGAQPAVNQAVVDVLLAEGIETQTARQLACLEHVTLELVRKQIDQRDFLLETAPERVKRPTAFLIRAIQRAFPEPDGYKPKADRENEAEAKLQQAEKRRRHQAQMELHVQDKQATHQQSLDQKRRAEAVQMAQLQAQWGTRDKEKQLWERVLADLQVQLKNSIGRGVIEHSRLLAVENGEAVIALPNAWAKEYVSQRLYSPICQALAQHLEGQVVTLQYITPDPAPTSSLATGVTMEVTADSHSDRQLPFG